jgi:hypothetical protein
VRIDKFRGPSSIGRLVATALGLALASTATTQARALEINNVVGQTLTIDITNTSILNYHFDNRNLNLTDPVTVLDDKYGEWLNRLNVQVGYWRFRAGVRLDTAMYFNVLPFDDVPAKVDELVTRDTSSSDRNNRVNDFYRELNTRYVNTYYPSKLFVGYKQPGIDATVGDFYVQLGRGLVFSVRKIDELALDTTVRGAKLDLNREFGPVSLRLMGFAGQMNPLRIDEASGRRLNGTSSPFFFGFPKAQDFTTYSFTPAGAVIEETNLARPSYIEDTAYGAHLEVGTKHVIVGVNAAMLVRQHNDLANAECNRDQNQLPAEERTPGLCEQQFPVPGITSNEPVRQHNVIRNISGSVHIPSIAKHGDFYVEVAGQQLANGLVQSLDPVQREKDSSGYAVYTSGSVRGGPVSVAIETKHYRKFYPLTGNIDSTTKGFYAPEYVLVAYSQLPTAEPIYVEPVAGAAPNNCITGGRANVDYRFNPNAKVYTWLGHYVSWSEVDPVGNEDCRADSRFQTNIWDYAVGAELHFEKRKSHGNVYVGARTSDTAEPVLPVPGTVFYREGYVRYDLVKHITGPFSVQVQGVHRRRYEPSHNPFAWWEGENYAALQWSPHISAIFGYEYLLKDGCRTGDLLPPGSEGLTGRQGPPVNDCHFFNGGVQFRSSGKGQGALKYVGQAFDTVSLFVGQRRGALRCVSGVCRQFPPFEGAKLEIVSRF